MEFISINASISPFSRRRCRRKSEEKRFYSGFLAIFAGGTGIGRRGRRGFVHNKQQPIDPISPGRGAGGRDRRRTGSGRPERTDTAPAAATSSLSPSRALHGDHPPTRLDQRKEVFAQHRQPRHRPGGGHVKLFAQAGRRPASSALAWISAAGTASSRQRPSKNVRRF